MRKCASDDEFSYDSYEYRYNAEAERVMNPDVEIIKTEVLSNNWYVLRKVTFKIRRRDGSWDTQTREAYDRGNGATILLYDRSRRTVVLTRQFRVPTYLNGNASGMLIETCAGLLDGDDPVQCVIRELQEETGFTVHDVRKVMEAYMSPGAVTELIHFFVAEYSPAQRTAGGGGIDDEDIEVIELSFDEALAQVASGVIMDGKTIMLLQYAALNVFN
jgi:nudix-type nucleoside diphosphatase (YffH/AdpP family)